MTLNNNNNNTLEIEDIDKIIVFENAASVICGLNALFMICIGVISCMRMMQNRRMNSHSIQFANEMDKLKSKMLVFIILYCVFGVFQSFSYMSSLLWMYYGSDSISYICTRVLPKLYGSFYALCYWAQFEFLLVRSDCVYLEQYPTNFTWIMRWMLWLGTKSTLVIFVPFIVVFWSAIIVKDSTSGSQFCFTDFKYEVTLAAMMMGASLMSLFVYSFIHPLLTSIKLMSKVVDSATHSGPDPISSLRKTVRKVLLLTVISFSTSLLTLSFMTVVASLHLSDRTLLVASVTVGNYDLLVNLICLLLMSNLWIPDKLLCCNCCKRQGVSKEKNRRNGDDDPNHLYQQNKDNNNNNSVQVSSKNIADTTS